MKKIFKVILFIIIPNIFGIIGSILGNSNYYTNFNKPVFAPNGYIFPIVWIILYTLMGISSYLIYNKTKNINDLKIYFIQLIINSLWTFFFFNLKWLFFSFIWIILLIILVIIMIKNFYKINKIAAYIQIPYLIWLLFAAILNLSIFILN